MPARHLVQTRYMCRNFYDRTRGFSLLEVTIAAMLFLMVMLGMVVLLVYNIRTIRTTRERTYIARALETVLEASRNLSWDEIQAQGNNPIAFSPSSPLFIDHSTSSGLFAKQPHEAIRADMDAESPLANATGAVQFTTVSTTLMKVTASVTYEPYSSRNRQVTITNGTYLAYQGIGKR